MFLSVLLLVFLHSKRYSFSLYLCRSSRYIHGRIKLAAMDIETEINVNVIYFSYNTEIDGNNMRIQISKTVNFALL